jgi:hypothetical protein
MSSVSISGCAGSECDNYEKLVSEREFNDSLLKWADQWIFSDRLDDEYFRMGSLSGPGRYGDSIDLAKIGASLPSGLQGAEVRALGQDRNFPEAVFIGFRRFQGIVIGRAELKITLNGEQIETAKYSRDRIAVFCSEERGISPVVFPSGP